MWECRGVGVRGTGRVEGRAGGGGRLKEEVGEGEEGLER